MKYIKIFENFSEIYITKNQLMDISDILIDLKEIDNLDFKITTSIYMSKNIDISSYNDYNRFLPSEDCTEDKFEMENVFLEIGSKESIVTGQYDEEYLRPITQNLIDVLKQLRDYCKTINISIIIEMWDIDEEYDCERPEVSIGKLESIIGDDLLQIDVSFIKNIK